MTIHLPLTMYSNLAADLSERMNERRQNQDMLDAVRQRGVQFLCFCLIKAKFHYAVGCPARYQVTDQLANQLASWFASCIV